MERERGIDNMNIQMLKDWNKRDKLLGIVAIIGTITGVTYVLFILYDPYYLRPCPYYVSNCPENNAGYFMNWLSDQIHKIIPYAVAQEDNKTIIGGVEVPSDNA